MIINHQNNNKKYLYAVICLSLIFLALVDVLIKYLHKDSLGFFSLIHIDTVVLIIISALLMTILITRNHQLYSDLMYDELTKVYSRKEIFTKFHQELIRSNRTLKPISIMIVDIDNFKYINDNYGHPIGDCILRNISSQLTDFLRSVDHIGRIGGDEFLIILPETNSEVAKDIASRIISLINNSSYQPSINTLINISVSIGLTAYIPTVFYKKTILTNANHVMDSVDKALYQVKKKGKNGCQLIDLSIV
ncbi:MAG: GGDEF domain-containing protein [Betaproteobacteria bacterium]|nr:GGDEF domain-containing protein [Betaproteobacteria bacterium]